MSRDITLADTIYIFFTTRAFATGIPTVLAGTPVVSAYENDSATQITAGITLGVSHDSVIGLNLLTIVATGANGYEASKDYTMVITTGTVDGVSAVGEAVGEFTIGRSAAAVDTADMQPLIEKMAYVGSHGLGVWIDDGAANTNTVLGTDGTPDNPVSTIAAATTIATALGSQRFYLVNDTVITLAQTYEGYEFIGVGEMTANTINLGSQDVDNSNFENVLISGTQGGTSRFQAKHCVLSVIVSMEVTALACVMAAGTLTLRDDCMFDSCWSAVAGTGTPILDINSVASVNVYFRHHSGGLQINNAVATTVMSYESDGQLIIDATCTSLAVVVRGNCSITDNGTTTSLTQDAALSLTSISSDVWDEILTGATHNIATSAGRRLRGIQEFQGYENGAVWIDTVNGTAGTTDFENGTVENPVDSIADANTIASSLNLSKFEIIPGSSITFAAAQNDQVFSGRSWTLALGGQSIDGSTIMGASVSGIGTNATGEQHFINCDIGVTTLPDHTHLIDCAIDGNLTLGEAGDYFFDKCYSASAGTATPALDFGAALNASNVSMRHYSGGIEIQNMGAGTGSYSMSLEGDGQLVINANCSATSTVAIRGHFTVTDNAGGAVTLSDDARYDVTQINDQVVDVINTDTSGEPGQEAPAATLSLRGKIDRLYKAWRNKKDNDGSTTQLFADDGTTVDSKQTTSEAAGTVTKSEWITGP